MTRRSKREIDRALEELGAPSADDVPQEIIITRRDVSTGWASDDPANEADLVSKTRVWRDQYGEWHSEEVGVDE